MSQKKISFIVKDGESIQIDSNEKVDKNDEQKIYTIDQKNFDNLIKEILTDILNKLK